MLVDFFELVPQTVLLHLLTVQELADATESITSRNFVFEQESNFRGKKATMTHSVMRMFIPFSRERRSSWSCVHFMRHRFSTAESPPPAARTGPRSAMAGTLR